MTNKALSKVGGTESDGSTQDRREVLKFGLLAGLVSMTTTQSPALARQPLSLTGIPVLHRIRTPVLDIGYEQHGNPAGFPILLLHGFPYDVRAFDGTLPGLIQLGFRVLVPYLRGYGPTRFIDPVTPRNGEQAALAQDIVDFCSALNLSQVVLAGFDWGNRAACIAAITHPTLVSGLVSIGGYSVQDTTSSGQPGSAEFEAKLWYQWYFNTARGRAGLTANRHDIIRYLWATWSPDWTYSDSDYLRSAHAFDNPDFVDVVIHSYRHRHANAAGEPRFLELERRLADRPPVAVPTVVLRPADSGFGAPSPDPAGDQLRFSNLVDRQIVNGAGHDLPVQRPDAVVAALRQLVP